MFRWLKSLVNRDGFQSSRPCRPHSLRPGLEALEDRWAPAILPVTGTGLLATQPGTLPYAVAHAQNGDIINIETAQPIVLTQGQLYLSHNVTIEATLKQAVISGDHLSRVFEVAPGAQVQLVNLDVIAGNGRANLIRPPALQALNSLGGGILNEGRLTLTRCTVSGNSADYGGGIDNQGGTLTMFASTVSGNVATFQGGGMINEFGTVTLSGDQLLKNSAFIGGALLSNHGTVVVTNSVVSLNSARNGGGGFYNFYGTMTLTHSTVSLNSRDGIDTVGPDPLKIGQSVFIGNTPHSVVGAYVNLGGNSGI